MAQLSSPFQDECAGLRLWSAGAQCAENYLLKDMALFPGFFNKNVLHIHVSFCVNTNLFFSSGNTYGCCFNGFLDEETRAEVTRHGTRAVCMVSQVP